MPFNVHVRPLARQQLRKIYVDLELLRAGAGERFDHDFDTVIARIAENPEQFPVADLGVRRALIRRFHYVVFFEVRRGAVRILAVFHGNRDLRDWRGLE